jgi:hypothetical protein
MFCYPSADAYVFFPSGDVGCNRAAIYDYINDTWSFDDLPNVTSATFAPSNLSTDWDELPETTFGSITGTWSADESTTTMFLGMEEALSIYASPDDASAVGEVSEDLSAPIKLYKFGMDMDELKAELRGYKLVSSLYPEIEIDEGDVALEFTVGSSDHPSQPPVWGITQTFDYDNYKLDHNVAGRYLHIKMESATLSGFSYVGLDMDVTVLGSR